MRCINTDKRIHTKASVAKLLQISKRKATWLAKPNEFQPRVIPLCRHPGLIVAIEKVIGEMGLHSVT